MDNPFVAAIAPAVAYAAAIGVFVLMLIALNAFFTKTTIGMRIMDATPWLGWADTEATDETEFCIHPSNYIRVPSR